MNSLSNSGYGWQNVINANGVTITIIGMLLVFFSLVLITIVISWTPYLLNFIGKFLPENEETHSAKSVKNISESEVVAAISAAFCHSMQSTNKQV